MAFRWLGDQVTAEKAFDPPDAVCEHYPMKWDAGTIYDVLHDLSQRCFFLLYHHHHQQQQQYHHCHCFFLYDCCFISCHFLKHIIIVTVLLLLLLLSHIFCDKPIWLDLG